MLCFGLEFFCNSLIENYPCPIHNFVLERYLTKKGPFNAPLITTNE